MGTNLARSLHIYLCGILFLLPLVGCASFGSPPSWTVATPKASGNTLYFVGVGSSVDGVEGEARDSAAKALIAEISRYIGVQVDLETDTRLTELYNELRSDVSQRISESSRARIGELKITDSWSSYSAGSITVYLLATCSRSSLLEERRRLAELAEEREQAIAIPEETGNRLFDDGLFYDAAHQYIAAAYAAASSEVENALVRFERNINRARLSISNLRLERVGGPVAGMLGVAPKTEFELQVRGVKDGQSIPQGGVDFKTLFQVLRTGGRATRRVVTGKTDVEGRLKFQLPPPTVVGSNSLTMALTMDSTILPLQGLASPYIPTVEALVREISTKRVVFEFTVDSVSKGIPTAVFVVDKDRGGNALERSNTTLGLTRALSESGFQVSSLDGSSVELPLGDDGLVEWLIEIYGADYERIIFGTAWLDGFETADDDTIVAVMGELSVLSTATNEVIHSTSGRTRAVGRSEVGTTSAAFRSLGRSLGEKLINLLP